MKKPLSHVLDYVLLCSVLALIAAFLIYFNGNPETQKLLVLLAGSWYVLWGYLHHHKEETLEHGIIFEYLIYGVLGSVLLIGLL